MNEAYRARGDDGVDADDPRSQALRVAVEALDERITNSRWLLTDTALYGLVDPDELRTSLRRDQDASEVLRSVLRAPTTGSL